jgi:hypothetical protein
MLVTNQYHYKKIDNNKWYCSNASYVDELIPNAKYTIISIGIMKYDINSLEKEGGG